MNFVQKLASHLTLANDLSPDSRDREYKGRIKQCFAAFGQKPFKSIGASVLGSIFLAPMLILFVFLLNKDLEAFLEGVNISKDMGLLLGASSPEVIDKYIVGYYNIIQKYMLYYFVPCMVLGGVGIAGVHNVTRNLLWNTNPRLFRDFFVGIKRHWYKYVVTWTVLGGLILGFIWPLLELIQYSYMSVSAPGGIWAMTIIFGILCLFAFMYFMVLQGMFVTHKYSNNALENVKHTLKNSIILTLLSPIQAIIILVLCAVPFAMCFIGMTEVALVCLALGGVALYPMISIQFSLYLSDNFTYYLFARQQARANKAQNKKSGKKKK